MAFYISKIKNLFVYLMDRKIKNPDWAYVNKYKNENKQILAPAIGENRIVFFGDSIIAGWITIHPEFFIGKTYINRGINGQTTSQMLLRFRPDVIALKPKIAIILAGTNDIAGNTGPTALETILGNLISMCELAKANNIQIILCSILPAYDYPWRRGMEPAEKIVHLNSMIQQYAVANEITFADYHTSMADDRKAMKSIYSEDGVHPNKNGYQIMESILENIQIM
jgi:lysophospholipase L1-like esterase